MATLAEWEAAVATVVLPTGVGTFVDDTLPTNFLSGVSVATADVPGNDEDVTFIGGEALNILVFTTDAALDAYDPDTVLASTVGQRIADSHRIFKDIRTILLVDLSGSTTLTFRQQLEDIATALSDQGFEYDEFDGINVVAWLEATVGSFYG